MSHSDENSHFDTSSSERYTASMSVALVNISANFILSTAQVIIGLLGHSQALVADGLHTLSDMFADLLVIFALKHGRKGADEEHPYGHERIETAVTMILGIVLIGVAIGIGVRAGLKLTTPEELLIPSMLTLWTALGTLAAKEIMYRYTIITANRFDSNMLRASAWHHRSDALSSLIVAVGIGGSLMGFKYLDAIAAIVVAAMILKVGIDLSWRSLRELVDTGLGRKDLESIRRAILSISGVKALHLLRTRRLGGQALADVHIIVDDHLSVSEGHQISEAVRAKLINEITPMTDVMVHIDTEEDVEGRSCEGLPLRDEALKRLDGYFREIPEARKIEHVTLHYLDGHIDVEILLPLSLASSDTATHELRRRFSDAVQGDKDIGSVNIYFH
ncbi:MAG: cation diffusion facilitator family transporter [Gammaproteobacteria bacterium]|nr:cation diffusion facilitator family transporter [Gammaproteobacteria bacterium]MDH3406433.1 cation diffusion facilitator family transporter [Gammaproteobacteria bacterium]MDH3561889.1 cation diffusion facilitator family transporter [Gammaproteobacteria bacterium]MDH5487029.1 cation diffusion facilitator family transporter [Gammaproteobacteria bacterium]